MKERLKYIASRPCSVVLAGLNNTLKYIEPWFAPDTLNTEFAPIFIIGAPRSGSTLFYQVLIDRFKFGYLTNFHCSCYGFPYLLHLFFGRWIPNSGFSDYKSKFGFVPGRWAPSECGRFWYRWFRRKPQYVPIEDVNLDKLLSLRQIIAGLTRAFKHPVLFKNMPCALRLQPIAAILPEAVFIVIQRDIFDNARSIMQTRQQIFGDINKWWSMEPPNIEELRSLESEVQVVEQIRSIYDLIDRDSQVIGKRRFLTLQYEELCGDVYGVTNIVREFLLGHGIRVGIRGNVPESFEISKEFELNQHTTQRLCEVISGTL